MANQSNNKNSSTTKNPKSGVKPGKKQKPNKLNFQRNMTRTNSTKSERRQAEDLDGAEKTFSSKTNDVAWYTKYPELVQAATSMAFGKPVGKPIVQTAVDNTTVNYFEPGILSLEFIPCYGVSINKYSALNQAALKFYTYMRSRLRTTGSYEAADQMMVMLAVDNLAMLHSMLCRVYGTSDTYTPVNYYSPDALLAAQGFNPAEFTKGEVRMKVRALANMLAVKLSNYKIPKGIGMLSRHVWMTQGYYVDSDTTRAQLYVFKPTGYWAYDSTTETTGTSLQFIRFPLVPEAGNNFMFMNFATLQNMIEGALNKLAGDEDVGNVCGDLINAFGEENMMTYPLIPEDYKVLPSYDTNVLSQIENCRFVHDLDLEELSIVQNPTVNDGAILFNPDLPSNDHAWVNSLNPVLVNFHNSDPTTDMIIEATRLTVCTTKSAGKWKLKTCGADLCTRWRMFSSVSVPLGFDSGATIFRSGASPSIEAQAQYLGVLAKFRGFDWSPILYTGTTGNVCIPSFEADNVAAMSVSQLENLNDAILYGMFDIPQIAVK